MNIKKLIKNLTELNATYSFEYEGMIYSAVKGQTKANTVKILNGPEVNMEKLIRGKKVETSSINTSVTKRPEITSPSVAETVMSEIDSINFRNMAKDSPFKKTFKLKEGRGKWDCYREDVNKFLNSIEIGKTGSMKIPDGVNQANFRSFVCGEATKLFGEGLRYYSSRSKDNHIFITRKDADDPMNVIEDKWFFVRREINNRLAEMRPNETVAFEYLEGIYLPRFKDFLRSSIIRYIGKGKDTHNVDFREDMAYVTKF